MDVRVGELSQSKATSNVAKSMQVERNKKL